MHPIEGPVHAPEIAGHWINSAPVTMRELRGRVVLMDFWDYTCVNCIRTLPYVQEWHQRYTERGLAVIGVHAPEFRFARCRENVKQAVRDLGLTYPIVLDNEYRIWQAYSNRCWPAKYLVDHKGYVRFFHFGEGDYAGTERSIQQLLKERDPKVELPALMPALRASDQPGAACYPVTPELYLGNRRGQLGNDGGFAEDRVAEYKTPQWLEKDRVYLEGPWLSCPEYLEVPAGTGGTRLILGYSAAEVNLVMAPPPEGSGRAFLKQDNKPIPEDARGQDVRGNEAGETYVEVEAPRMYYLVRNRGLAAGTLELGAAAAGLRLYAFTFVSCVAGQS